MFGQVSKRDLLRALERERAAFTLERAQLLDRIASLAGRPWTLPPAEIAPVLERTVTPVHDPETLELLGQIKEL